MNKSKMLKALKFYEETGPPSGGTNFNMPHVRQKTLNLDLPSWDWGFSIGA